MYSQDTACKPGNFVLLSNSFLYDYVCVCTVCILKISTVPSVHHAQLITCSNSYMILVPKKNRGIPIAGITTPFKPACHCPIAKPTLVLCHFFLASIWNPGCLLKEFYSRECLLRHKWCPATVNSQDLHSLPSRRLS